MSPVDPALKRALADNVWLHFFQMGHCSSTCARPPILVRGEGSRVWDADGNAYIDALSGLFCVNAGYGRREIVEAMTAQALAIPYVAPFSFPSLPQIELAARLAAISPMGAQTRTFFVTGGSEAVEAALKLVKAYQRKQGCADRYKIIARRAAYHGTSIGALSVNGVTGYRNGFGPLVAGARHAPLPYRYRCDYCALAERCAGTCADEIERLVEFEGPETIAAIILEPVQNSGGAIVPPPGYMQRVREICDRHGIVFIADEVICGFGRVGAWFGSTALGVVPDIMTVAKGITSGYAPLGAVMVRKAIADAFIGDESEKFMHGVTFGGHPISCAAALANLSIIEREGLCERSATTGAYLIDELRAALADHPHVGEIRGKGLFVALELVRDRQTREPFEEGDLMGWLSEQFRRRGLICRADDRLEPVVQLAPPLNTPRDQIDTIVAIVVEVLNRLGRRVGTQPALHPVAIAETIAA